MIEDLRRSSAHVFVDDLASPVLNDDDFHHLGRVMRLRRGENVTCSDGRGSWRLAQWDDGLHFVGEINMVPAPSATLSVAVAPVKGDRTEFVVEKLVEIGIDRIVILSPTDHSVVRWSSDKTTQVLERFRRIARAAAMQSRRVFLPEVVGPIDLDDLLGGDEARGQVAMAEPGGSADISTIQTLLIGPEGGFSAEEVAKSPQLVGLGASILRAETAAIVGASLMVAHQRR